MQNIFKLFPEIERLELKKMGRLLLYRHVVSFYQLLALIFQAVLRWGRLSIITVAISFFTYKTFKVKGLKPPGRV